MVFGVNIIGSDIISERFNELNVSSIDLPSGFVSPFGHHDLE